jgi:plasmid stabilization system protein ParE
MEEEKSYEVVIASPAVRRYQSTILQYLLDHYSISRVVELEGQFYETIASLSKHPNRGTKERFLKHLKEEFRFIIFRPAPWLELKIIYTVDEVNRLVQITDFYPTKMNPENIGKS